MSGRDFRALLAGDLCWDAGTEAVFAERGEAVQDRMLQNREEVIALAELIERAGVRSYLEIGVWTGRLLSALHRIFAFDMVAACDHGWAEELGLPIRLPPDARFFRGDSQSTGFEAFRADLGHVDLVLIDANHSRRAVQADFELNRRFPNRFLALHDICGRRRVTRGVSEVWRSIDHGFKAEIVRPHLELGLDHSLMGIGVWSAVEDPSRFLR